VETAETDSVYRGDITRLLQRVLTDRGLDLRQYRQPYVERRLAARMRALGLHTYRQYERHLREHGDEYDKLLDTLTINVTDFFRDESVYRIIRQRIVPDLVKEKLASRQHAIRVWSAGCATGEEAYSIAMTVLTALGEHVEDFLFTVFATDIDPRALEVARKATYDEAKLAHIPRPDQSRFIERGDGTFTFRPEVTRHMKFRRLNLFEDEPIHLLDAVFCRNVFIYFTKEQQARVLERFHEGLHPGGYLVLGRSEKMPPAVAGLFELVDGRERVYRKPYNGDGRRK
jgi:chemotaxis methyl-accepting protein methylase